MRVEPHNAVCGGCGALLVDAHLTGTHDRVLLDAVPDHSGVYRAHFNGTAWIARNVGEIPDHEAWFGMRRRLHVCRPADTQLELGGAA